MILIAVLPLARATQGGRTRQENTLAGNMDRSYNTTKNCHNLFPVQQKYRLLLSVLTLCQELVSRTDPALIKTSTAQVVLVRERRQK